MGMTRHGYLLALALMAAAIVFVGCQSSNDAGSPPQAEVANDGGQPVAAQPPLPPAPQEEGPRDDGGAGDARSRLRQAGERQQLEEQKRDVVAQYFYDAAIQFYQETKYKAARDNLLKVLELNPNQELREKAAARLREIEDLLGIGGGSESARLANEVERLKVKVDQAVAQVRVRMEEGRKAMDANEYEKALGNFDQALEILRWLPYHAPKRELQTQLESLKETALRRQREWQAEQARTQREEADLAARSEERQRQEFLEERIAQLFRKANIEFRQERYELAGEFAKQILHLDPFNKDAQRLQEISVRAQNAKVADRNRESYIEEWTSTWEEVSKKAIPQHDIVQFPDEETWKRIENRGGAAEEGSLTASLPAEHREILNKLENQVVGRLEFENHPLTEVIEFLRDNFDLNMMIDPELTRNRTDEELRVSLKVSDLSLRDALELILSITKLGYEIQEGVIVIKDKENITGNQVTQVYSVQDLTLGIIDFPGISLDLTSEDDGLGVGFGDDSTGPEPLSIDLLQQLIEENIAPGTWDPPNSVTARQGRLIIRHTPEVHEEIQSLLYQLRQSTGLLVSIETRFLDVRDDFLQDIGVDFRGLGAQSPRGDVNQRNFRFPGVSPAFAAANQAQIGFVAPQIDPINLFNSAIFDPRVNVGAGTQRAPGPVRSERGSFQHTSASIASRFAQQQANLDDVLFGRIGGGAFQGAGTDNSAGIFFDNGNESDVRGRIEHLFSTAFGTTSILTNSGGLNLQFGFLDEVALNVILKAVEKSERINLLTAPRITAFNTQRANVAVLRQFGYIKDFDVQVAQNATVADPIVGIVQDGVVLDVKPVISANRKFITMELQPAFAQVDQPIRTFVTTLGQQGQAVTIELPRVTLRKVETTVTIPDGGTIMIGGLTDLQERERRSDVPFVKRIPFVSFLFSKKQKLSFRENLVILVRAEIVYWKEIEPGPGVGR